MAATSAITKRATTSDPFNNGEDSLFVGNLMVMPNDIGSPASIYESEENEEANGETQHSRISKPYP